MSSLAGPFRQLVERRLWPLAVLLLIVLLAVPLVLASGGGEVPADTAPTASAGTAAGTVPVTAAAAGTQPIVSVGAPEAREKRRRVVGIRKDPFRPAEVVKAESTNLEAPGTGNANMGNQPSGAPSAPSAPSAPTGSAPTQTISPVSPVQGLPKQTYELYSLKVRFGDSAATKLEAMNVKRLTALPSAEEAIVIYLGLLKDLKTAVFLVDAGASVQGDGRCSPSPSNCQTLRIKEGDTAFFDVADPSGNGQVSQYQLDVLKVVRKRTTSASAAAASRKAVSVGGRRALRARTSRLGAWRYDARTGTLKRLSRRALRAEAAARAARQGS